MALKYLGLATACFCSWTLVAMAQPAGAPASGAGAASSGMSSSTSAPLPMQDQKFANDAAEAGLAEVQQGQLAEQKGDKAVRAVGRRLVADHTKANSALQNAAQTLGLTLPTSPSPHQEAAYKKLQGLSGAAFDKAYLAGQRQAHEQAIALFSTEATNGQAPALKNFAAQTLPILRTHLKMIKAAQS